MAAAGDEQLIKGFDNYDVLLVLLLLTLGVLFVAIMGLAFAIYYMVKLQMPKAEVVEAETAEDSWWSWFYNKFNAAKPIAQEGDILMDHEYDGIRELDNDLPPWWKGLFYASIALSVVYLGVYHVWDGDNDAVSVREYKMAMVKAEAQKKAYLEKMASLIDESNVEVATEAAALEEGKKIFDSNCKSCHGAELQGGIGPNLTDEYWLHGGDVQAVFKTIKYGVPQNGMLAWESKLTPMQIKNVSSYILSLQGSNPPNPKAPQGEKWVAEEDAADTEATTQQ
ncbi:hypothetical protein GCM10023331_10320 [Algivirga pacifica]|uniref:Cytochrome c domain-containing protein n=2 Tax=Algivirga pacifica TaxID=1162670 RepID=A0ABP9D575_9BACT